MKVLGTVPIIAVQYLHIMYSALGYFPVATAGKSLDLPGKSNCHAIQADLKKILKRA